MNWLDIEEAIATATNIPFKVRKMQPLGGGSINACYRLQGNNVTYFVKMNKPTLAFMFAAEFVGLQEISQTQTIRVPNAVTYGTTAQYSYLVLEYLELNSGNGSSDKYLGRQLAAMHLQQQAYFGWHQENTIGSTPQVNDSCSSWVDFWREKRLGLQLQLAADNGFGGRLQKLGELVNVQLSGFFSGYSPQPSLLHGDLWAGNAAVDIQGVPVIYDPACYYGDHEADLAMTELFGGFGVGFYSAYREVFPLDVGYSVRKNLYNLYHVLNHLNLFGGGYSGQALRIMEKLLAEIK